MDSMHGPSIKGHCSWRAIIATLKWDVEALHKTTFSVILLVEIKYYEDQKRQNWHVLECCHHYPLAFYIRHCQQQQDNSSAVDGSYTSSFANILLERILFLCAVGLLWSFLIEIDKTKSRLLRRWLVARSSGSFSSVPFRNRRVGIMKLLSHDDYFDCGCSSPS